MRVPASVGLGRPSSGITNHNHALFPCFLCFHLLESVDGGKQSGFRGNRAFNVGDIYWSHATDEVGMGGAVRCLHPWKRSGLNRPSLPWNQVN